MRARWPRPAARGRSSRTSFTPEVLARQIEAMAADPQALDQCRRARAVGRPAARRARPCRPGRADRRRPRAGRGRARARRRASRPLLRPEACPAMKAMGTDIGTIHFVGIGGIGMSGIAEVMHQLGYKVQGSDVAEGYVVEGLRKARHPGRRSARAPTISAMRRWSSARPRSSAAIPEIEAAAERRLPRGPARRNARRADADAEDRRGRRHPRQDHHDLDDRGAARRRRDRPDGDQRRDHQPLRLQRAARQERLDGGRGRRERRQLPAARRDDRGRHQHRSRASRALRQLRRGQGRVRRVRRERALLRARGDVRRPSRGAERSSAAIRDRRVVTYGFSALADLRADNVAPVAGGSRFDAVVLERDGERRTIEGIALPMPGRHNVQNALAAIARRARARHRRRRRSSRGFARSTGVKRRFTRVGEVDGATIIDDYAHHPVEIRAVLSAAREGARGSAVIAVVQPHRYTRLRRPDGGLPERLQRRRHRVRRAGLCRPARSRSRASIPTRWPRACARAATAWSQRSTDADELAAALRDIAAEGDMVICMGAGDITKWAAGLADGIGKARASEMSERRRRMPQVPRQADGRTRRWRRWCGSRAAATPNGCSSRPTSTTSPTSCATLDPDVPVMALGLGSNLIVRDGGVPGVVVRLGKAFAKIERARRGHAALRRRRERHPRFLDRARCRHRRPRIPARHSRHRRRLRADERRRLRPRGAGHPRRCDAGAARRATVETGRPSSSATPIATANCPKARSWSRRRFAGTPGDPAEIGAEMDRDRRARARNRSRCAAAPAARPSRIRRATRPGR